MIRIQKLTFIAALLTWCTLGSAYAQTTKPQETRMTNPTFGSTVIYVEAGVRDVLEFYKAAFGFSIRYYDDNLKFGELETGQTSIMIASYAAGEYMVGTGFQRSASKRPTDVEIAFLMLDVPAAYARAIAAGATPLREPRTMPWGQVVAYVSSVEGTLIGLLSPPPQAKPQ
jgi:lactoylglutathione lyase